MIGIDNLTPKHGKEFHNIYIVDDKGYSVKVSPNWMPPFVAPHIAVPETKTLDVRVEACDDATIRLAKNKIGIA
jgi:hypothetical protein